MQSIDAAVSLVFVVKDAARSDGNCRWKRIVHNRIWEKGVESIDPSKKDLATFRNVECIGIEFQGLQAVAEIVVGKGLLGDVEFSEALVGTDPQVSFSIRECRINDGIGKPVFCRIYSQDAMLCIRFDQANV